MTVTVKKLGGSMAVVIPKGVARDLELAEGSTLDISATADAIIMRKPRDKRRRRRPIADLVAGISRASYRRRSKELAERGPVGVEIW